MAKITYFILLIFFSLSLQAQVYRCDGPSGPVYSQMPCAADAEHLVDYDPHEEAVADAGPENGQEIAGEPAQKPPTAMENFVATLYKQRQQQIGDMDKKIDRLQNQLNNQGEGELDDGTRASITAELSTLKSERDSVSEQYVALISEAESRAGSAEGAD